MFKVGQRVKPIQGLVPGGRYGGLSFYTEMFNEIKDGAVIKSIEVNPNGNKRVYITHGDGYIYPIELFESVHETDEELFDAYLKGHLSEQEYMERRRRG